MMGMQPLPPEPVLIVDDDAAVLRSIAAALRFEGISRLVECSDSRDAHDLLASQPFCALLLDLNMPHVSGEEILVEAQEHHPDIPVIILTGVNEVDSAVNCMKAGAFDYVVKPVERERLLASLTRALELYTLRLQTRNLQNRLLEGELDHPDLFAAIITRNGKMVNIFHYLETIGASTKPILVTGETGVGKELVVQAAHAVSTVRGPLLSVNVAGLDDTVFTDTLFGHLKGAFTGAAARRRGLVERASGGTLHLDEIGDLSRQSQLKLLRLLQDGDYYKLGADTPTRADVRIIASTNRDLKGLMDSGMFRHDLYYRLANHHINIPPLRERKEDIPLLVNSFCDKSSAMLGKEPPLMSEPLVRALSSYDFPGNVRELETLLHDLVSSNRSGRLTLRDIQDRGDVAAVSVSRQASNGLESPLLLNGGDETSFPTLEEATLTLAAAALERCDDNKSEAARLLGITRQRLARILKKQRD